MIFGYLSIIFKNVIYGVSIYFTGNLTENVDVLDILALRFLLSFLCFFLLKSFKIIKIDIGLKDVFKKTNRTKYIHSVLLASLFEPVLYMFCETMGISGTTGITASCILSLAPISNCICEVIFLKEKCSFVSKIFLAMGIIGVLYIVVNTDTSTGTDTAPGIMFMILTLLCGSLFMVFSRKSSEHFSSFEITYVYVFAGMTVFNFVNIIRHIINQDLYTYFSPFFNVQNLTGFIFLSVISTVVATVLSNYALSKIKISVAAAFGGIGTLVGIVTDVLFNGSKLYYFHFIGMALILARMIGVSYIEIKEQNKIDKTERDGVICH